MISLKYVCVVLMCFVSGGPAAGQTERAAEPAAEAGGERAVSFAEAARTVTASIQKAYFDEKTGLYATSLEKREPEFMWGNGIMFSALTAAARHEPATYRPVLDQFFSAMDGYWDTEAPIPGYEPSPTKGRGHDKYYDDNQWMVITFMEAYDLTRDVKYLDRAEAALKFALSGWDEELGGGIWWHEKHKGGSKNTCANGPAAVACLRVARYRDRATNIEWAKKLVKWTSEHLQDEDGLFFDNKRAADGDVAKFKLTYNAALMLRANLGLYRATGEAAYLGEAKRIGGACEAFVKEKDGSYRDALRFTHLLVEADLELYRATAEERLLERAKKNGEAVWARWRTSPPKDLIEQAAIARMLWLLADQESKVGREFWGKADEAERKEEAEAGGPPKHVD